MIEIDQESKIIFFFHKLELVKLNPIKYDNEMHEFKLLSAHACPECNRVIDAYYVGTLPIETTSGQWASHPYVPSNGHYCISDPHYSYGHELGGGYMTLENHNDTYCKTHIASVVGITEGIKSFTDKEIKVTELQIKKFANDIFENKIPGISLIPDVCNNRESWLAINEKTFAKNITYNSWSERDKEYKWGQLFTKLVIGDPEVKLNYPSVNEGDSCFIP